jgi:hypothetical protein
VIPLEQNAAVLEPIRVPAWAWLVVALMVTMVYALAVENGAVLAEHAHRLHEFFHDARHFIGVPCH